MPEDNHKSLWQPWGVAAMLSALALAVLQVVSNPSFGLPQVYQWLAVLLGGGAGVAGVVGGHRLWVARRSFGPRPPRNLRYDFSQVMQGRMYIVDRDRGHRERHVLLRTKTIRRMLDAVHTVAGANGSEALEKLGLQVGRDFGQVLKRIFQGRHFFNYSDQEKLAYWFAYDRGGWMGLFSKQGDFPPSKIQFDHAFLCASEREGDEPSISLCSFLAGYVHGILQEVFDQHSWELHSACPAGPHLSCTFEVTRSLHRSQERSR